MDQTKSIKLKKKRLESAEERRAWLDKRAKRRMKMEEQKNEARKKECKRQLERKLRLETATRPLKLAMETEEERKERLKKMVANHSAEVSP